MKKKAKYLGLPSNLFRLALIGCTLALISLACNLPWDSSGEDAGVEVSIETAVAQTMAAREAAVEQPSKEGDQPSGEVAEPLPSSTDTPLPVPTNTPSNTPTPGPTNTPTQTSTMTLTPTETFTLTPEMPMIEVSVSTNCRTGPGKVYDQVGVLLVGEKAEIIAKEPQGSDWYIRNPDQAGGFCWIWGQYATISGNTEHLPVFTPPPTPTPSQGFTVSFHELEFCGGKWFIEYKVANVGSLALLSWHTSTTDTNIPATVVLNGNQFIEKNGCANLNAQNDLLAGETGYALSNWLVNDPTGHNLTGAITVCTQDGLGGTCMTKNISFKP